jgi:hypothetical protein
VKPLALGLLLGFLLGVGAARLTAAPPPSPPRAFLPVQFPEAPEGCEPQVYLFLNGEFFRLLPTPGGEPQELFPVEPAPNPFGGS